MAFVVVEALVDRIGKVVGRINRADGRGFNGGSDNGDSARVVDGRKKTLVIRKKQRTISSFRTKSFD